jgi:hypothetical protein
MKSAALHIDKDLNPGCFAFENIKRFTTELVIIAADVEAHCPDACHLAIWDTNERCDKRHEKNLLVEAWDAKIGHPCPVHNDWRGPPEMVSSSSG